MSLIAQLPPGVLDRGRGKVDAAAVVIQCRKLLDIKSRAAADIQKFCRGIKGVRYFLGLTLFILHVESVLCRDQKG